MYLLKVDRAGDRHGITIACNDGYVSGSSIRLVVSLRSVGGSVVAGGRVVDAESDLRAVLRSCHVANELRN